MGTPGYYILCPNGHQIGIIENGLSWGEDTFKKLEELEKKKCPICGRNAKYNFCHYGNISDCTGVNLVWNPEENRWIIPKKLTDEQKKELNGHIIRKAAVIKTEKVIKNMTICENCKNEKKVTDIEGHLLCKDCEEDIVRCDFCKKFLAVNYDALMVGNFGKLSVPSLSLPDMMTDAVFCNIEHLEGYLKNLKQGKGTNKGHTCEC